MTKTEFQNHYEVLGLSHGASGEEISRAYQLLARELHPNTPRTGNKAAFDKLNRAYEALSDPETRKAFDKLFSAGVTQREGPRFAAAEFFDALNKEMHRRMAVLCVLYDQRRRQPDTPSLTFRELEGLMDITSGELSFSMWFLKQRGLAGVDDKSAIQITVSGMEFLEGQAPRTEDVMPFIRQPES